MLTLAIGCRYNFDAIDDAQVADGFVVPGACLDGQPPATCSTAASSSVLAVGEGYGCVVRSGALACWGSNIGGQLGLCESVQVFEVPTRSFDLPAVLLTLGERHSCALVADGTGWCWGSNYEGESGRGISAQVDPLPTQLPGRWRQLATRRFHTCGIDDGGALWCWGHNDEGTLGLGDQSDRGTPQQVGTATDWAFVATSNDSTCALKTNGTAWCWGGNAEGILGDGTQINRSTPSQVFGGVRFTSLSMGKHHACALTAAGTAWCWGRGAEGQLGNSRSGAGANESAPFEIAGLSFLKISAGWFQTCAIEAGTQSLWCWGDNTVNAIEPGPSSFVTRPVEIGGVWADVATGGFVTCVRSGDGSRVACVGSNDSGRLGVGDQLPRSTLVDLCF